MNVTSGSRAVLFSMYIPAIRLLYTPRKRYARRITGTISSPSQKGGAISEWPAKICQRTNGSRKKLRVRNTAAIMRHDVGHNPSKKRTCIGISCVLKEKRAPCKIEHRDKEHHEDPKAVVGLEHPHRRFTAKGFQNGTIDHLDHDPRDPGRDRGETEPQQSSQESSGPRRTQGRAQWWGAAGSAQQRRR